MGFLGTVWQKSRKIKFKNLNHVNPFPQHCSIGLYSISLSAKLWRSPIDLVQSEKINLHFWAQGASVKSYVLLPINICSWALKWLRCKLKRGATLPPSGETRTCVASSSLWAKIQALNLVCGQVSVCKTLRLVFPQTNSPGRHIIRPAHKEKVAMTSNY